MLFCPKCGSILIPKKDDKKNLVCSCGYSSKEKKDIVLKEKIDLKKEEKIEVVKKKLETLPVTKAECSKCGNKEAYFWLIQTRSGDEAETKFFQCTKCDHRWREY